MTMVVVVVVERGQEGGLEGGGRLMKKGWGVDGGAGVAVA